MTSYIQKAVFLLHYQKEKRFLEDLLLMGGFGNSPYEFIRKLLCEISLIAFFHSVAHLMALHRLYLEFSRVLMLRQLNYINLYCIFIFI